MTQAFNLSQLGNNINSSGQVSLTAGVTGALPVANGGTALTSAGTSGYVLTSTGSAFAMTAPSGGLGGQTIITTTGSAQTFTIPAGKTVVKVTVVGGGGGGAQSSQSCCFYVPGGAGGGVAIKYLSGLTPGNTLSVTIGTGGAANSTINGNGTAGGTTSVASGTQTITTISATGGAAGTAGNNYSTAIPSSGVGSNGDLNLYGDPGVQSISATQQNPGSSIFGGTGSIIVTGTGSNLKFTTKNYGCGGATNYQANNAAQTGLAGTQGIVIFEY